MIEELFRCMVYEMVRSDFIRGLAHWEFRFAIQCIMYSNERWRLPFHAESLARRADPDNILKVRIGQIADIRDKWLNPELGFFIRCDYHGDPGLEIAPRFRRDRRKAEEGPPQQMELLPQGIDLLPPPNSPLRVRKDSDSEKKSNPDSFGCGTPVPPVAPPSGSLNRILEGRKAYPFIRTKEQLFAMPMGRRLHDYIGPVQMATELRESGAEWLRICRDETAELADLLETAERTRTDRTTGKHRAQDLTRRLGERRKAA